MVSDINRPAVLALADGTIYRGYAFGAERDASEAVTGEVVFNTSMFGYQEIITDPSYAGQMLCFTTPHIGNVGCNPSDVESDHVFAEAIIVRNLSKVTSNFRARGSLSSYLADVGIMGIYGLDTRALTCQLRDLGSQMGAMASGTVNPDDLVDVAQAQGSMEGKDYVQHVTCKHPYTWNEGTWSLQNGYRVYSQEKLLSRPHLVVIDCGVKRNILRLLIDVGFRITVVPATSSAVEIIQLSPDALFISNGPGDPATVHYVVSSVRELLGRFPIFGICLGHQILAQVFGGQTYKLKFGHRGGNHPVKDYSTGKVEITVQNHGFAVDPSTLPSDVTVSHINLNDQTIEGLDVVESRAFCVQYHPESSPGPRDASYLFNRFFERVIGYDEAA